MRKRVKEKEWKEGKEGEKEKRRQTEEGEGRRVLCGGLCNPVRAYSVLFTEAVGPGNGGRSVIQRRFDYSIDSLEADSRHHGITKCSFLKVFRFWKLLISFPRSVILLAVKRRFGSCFMATAPERWVCPPLSSKPLLT